uniref:hypothetical protein n=1 Tax=Burkholderia diffusa TaxID=488732 RepID=UPI001CC62580|nr:hypothetical protein [Burkholderia diffusa]
MSININEALPALETISEQQEIILGKLQTLVETFKREPGPVEPTLRSMLSPLSDGMDQMHTMLSQTSNLDDSPVNLSGS